jgi:6-phosphogluconolactonase
MATLPEVQIYPDRPALTLAAAAKFALLAQEAVRQRGRFLVCLAGGSTPLDTYRLLARAPYAATLPWEQMVFMWGDERMVPPDDPQSNFGQAQAALLSHIPVRAEQILRMRGELPPAQAAADYTTQLRRYADPGLNWPRFDLALLGLGTDGHIASLFPHQRPALRAVQPAIAVQAQYAGRPAQRLTLTPPVFNAARQVVFLVAGADKAAALAASLDPASDPFAWPARLIDPPGGWVTWLIEAQAAN